MQLDRLSGEKAIHTEKFGIFNEDKKSVNADKIAVHKNQQFKEFNVLTFTYVSEFRP